MTPKSTKFELHDHAHGLGHNEDGQGMRKVPLLLATNMEGLFVVKPEKRMLQPLIQ